MRGFGSFVRKEMLHILRDRRTMLIVLLMPVVQMLLFGFAISTEVNNVDFAVVAPKRSESIRQQVERLSANDYFTFKGYIVPQSIDEVLRCGGVDAVVGILSEAVRRVIADIGVDYISVEERVGKGGEDREEVVGLVRFPPLTLVDALENAPRLVDTAAYGHQIAERGGLHQFLAPVGHIAVDGVGDGVVGGRAHFDADEGV